MSVINPERYGVSFSLKQCRNFGLDPQETFDWLASEAGFRRFRLMSYWNEHEKQPGVYDFSALDWQIAHAEQYGCVVTLCLGARQPRWPENHWPEWAWQLSKAGRTAALLTYIKTVVKRYQGRQVVMSYQLENEALLRSFGERPEIDRRRLLQEYQLIKQLDQKRPIIMTTSTAWGIPIRQPIPDIVGFSFYRILYGAGSYHHALHFPRLDRLRARAIQVLHHRPSFIHELQLEPWGPALIWNMSTAEQDKSMSVEHIQTNLRLAQRTLLSPIDLWGGEWWYWRLQTKYDPTIWQAVQTELQDSIVLR
jgi:hypothetical protein